MPDSYPLDTIYFYLTEGCNLACRHCWINPRYQGEGENYPALELILFQKIIEQAKPLGLTAVKLTGGEPLLHPQIREILDVVKTEDIRLTVETNGVLCTPELAEKMKACKNAFVSVSLDGVDAETHDWVRGVPGSFEAALAGIRNLVAAGLKPQIIMSIMRRNKDQLEGLVRLAEKLGAGSIKFNLVQPVARGEQMRAANETLSIAEMVEIGKWVETQLKASTGLRIVYSHPKAFLPLGKIFGKGSSQCGGNCGILGILGVLANGNYALCGIGETVPDLVFGNAATDRLAEVWKQAPVLNQLREGFPKRFEGVCGRCLMKNQCLGYCVALNYYSSKSLWAPFWYCEMAEKEGLFPLSRLAA